MPSSQSATKSKYYIGYLASFTAFSLVIAARKIGSQWRWEEIIIFDVWTKESISKMIFV